MIQINSFIPTSNFTRRVWEFHEDKIVVKTKSLAIDIENEINYEKVKFIQTKKSVDLIWLWLAFFIFGILSITMLGLGYFHLINPTVKIIQKVVAGFALLLTLPSFRKYEYYHFLDKEKFHLGNVKIDTKKKRELISEAISLIKRKTEIITEMYLDKPFPSDKPTFEIVEFDFPDFLNTSTIRFYEDRIIETDKSLAEEEVRITKYDELNGKTKLAQKGNDNWGYVFSYWLLFVCITGYSVSVFFSGQTSGNSLLPKLFFGGLALLIPMFFLPYIKSEILVFHDKQDNGVFWTKVNKANREKLNQIVEFVNGKVESQNQKPA